MNFFAYRYGKHLACDSDFDESKVRRTPKGKGGGQFAKKPETLAKEDQRDVLNRGEPGESNSSAALDAEYMDAVKSGDMDKAAKMVREAAARAMPSTKVAEEDGMPKTVFHGTQNASFVQFRPNKEEGGAVFFASDHGVASAYGKNMKVPGAGSTYDLIKNALKGNDERMILQATSALYGSECEIREAKSKVPFDRGKKSGYTLFWDNGDSRWSHVFPRKDVLEELKKNLEWHFDPRCMDTITEEDKRGIFHCFLNLENPLIIDADGAEDAAVPFDGKTVPISKINRAARERGHDGVIIKNVKEYGAGKTDDICVFDPRKIKASNTVVYDDDGNIIPLSKRFDLTNPDIRY